MLHLLTLLAGLSSAASDGPAPPAEPIAVGTVIEREAKAKDAHRYSIDLRAGEYFQSVVEQWGVDVSQTVSGPDGTVVLEVDSFSANSGPDPVAFVAPAAGRYLLVVTANDDEPGSRYQLRVEAVRDPTPVDLLRVGAVRATSELSRLSGDPAQGRTALEHGRRAVQAWGELGDRRMVMYAEQGIGFVHRAALSEHKEAKPPLERALSIAREIGDSSAESPLLYNLGEINARLGRFAEARACFEQALAIHRANGRRDRQGFVLMALGRALLSEGHPQAALDRLHEALQVYETIGDLGDFLDPRGLAQLYMGNALVALHDYELALSHFEAARPALSRYRTMAPQPLQGMGAARFGMGDLPGARAAYSEALRMWREVGVPGLEADTSLRVADVHRGEGDLRGAEALLESALGVFTSRGDPIGRSRAQCGLGNVRHGLGAAAAARAAFEAALAAAPQDNASLRACAELGLARLALDEGRLDVARGHAEAALASAESLRASVAAPRARTVTLEAQQAFYETLIEIRSRLHDREPRAGHGAAALEISERARARTLLELLAEARVEVHEGVDSSLREQERLLRDQLNAAAKAQEEAQAARRAERVEALGREILDLTGQLAQAQGDIRRASPHYAALSQPAPLTADDIRRQVLDEDTLLIEYALGEKVSRLWVVSTAGLMTLPLAPRADIERAARRLHAEVSAPPAAGRATGDAVAELSRLVLPPAAWAALDRKRLLIVAPGALQYVPFAAMHTAGVPLLSRFEVLSAPSASVVATLRREPRRPPTRTVAVFADPVFDVEDPRVAVAPRRSVARDAGSASEERVQRGLRAAGRGTLARLPFSRQEADAVRALVPPGTGLHATGFDANRAAAVSPALAEYRIVHLATHGVLNTRQPDLSGVVLSLVDSAGRPQDGFLRLHDIYNLRLNADLVVLSACQTALGRDVGGEGLVGLTRGFMYAGAKAVVASLWQVDDESTAELMKRFYRGMLLENRRPADALRAAQLDMSRQRRWSAPFHWAGFVLQGDWR